jgi:hypothetical protein
MLFITISAAVQSLTIFFMNKEVKKTFFMLKLVFVQQEKCDHGHFFNDKNGFKPN